MEKGPGRIFVSTLPFWAAFRGGTSEKSESAGPLEMRLRTIHNKLQILAPERCHHG